MHTLAVGFAVANIVKEAKISATRLSLEISERDDKVLALEVFSFNQLVILEA